MPEMTKSKVATIKKGRPIPKVSSSTIRGRIKAGTPTTIKILKTFEPKILPRAISYFFFKAAWTETTNSGKEVPTAIAVMAMREVLIFKSSDNFKTDSMI